MSHLAFPAGVLPACAMSTKSCKFQVVWTGISPLKVSQLEQRMLTRRCFTPGLM